MNYNYGEPVTQPKEEKKKDLYEVGPGLAQFEEKEYVFEKQNFKDCHQETDYEPYNLW